MSADFLAALWTPSAGYGELRAIRGNGEHAKPSIVQEFIPLDQPHSHEEAYELAHEYDRQGWDVYMGVLRRKTQAGKTCDVVDHAPVLWADVDPYKWDGYQSPASFYEH